MANPVVFSALKNSGTYKAGSYIDSYAGFLTDYGNAFDLSSGIFTAPRSGIFEFSTEQYYNEDVDETLFVIQIEKNNVKELAFSAFTSGYVFISFRPDKHR